MPDRLPPGLTYNVTDEQDPQRLLS
jgi:hypothetical protein